MKIVRPILFCLISIGLGGFQANIVQFGLDQFPDASTIEITSFIVWYICTEISAGFIVELNIPCLNEQNELFIFLIICLSLTLALILLICCNHWLIKEPATQNPLKLIYKIIKYAAVTKHPRCRSAFTYCEDELPSRIDFGKSKYGGPFTTEQVEDVKTFMRLLPIMSFIGAISSALFASNYLYTYLDNQYNQFTGSNRDIELGSRKGLTECYIETSMNNIVYLGITLLIILQEFLLYPLFHRCIGHKGMKSLRKITIAITLQILQVTVLTVLDVISRRNYLSYNEYNVTVQCVFYKQNYGQLRQALSYQWLAIPKYIHYISLIFLLTGAIEFICSQVPYSMIGIVIGAQCTLILVCSIPTVAMGLIFQQEFSIWGDRIISCEFWYALILLAMNLSIFFVADKAIQDAEKG